LPSQEEEAGRHVTGWPPIWEQSDQQRLGIDVRKAITPYPAQPWRMSSGKSAETVTFGTSTTLLIRRSTATLAIT
jgi:hypothetical protein